MKVAMADSFRRAPYSWPFVHQKASKSEILEQAMISSFHRAPCS